MKTRQIGQTDLHVFPIGLGGMPLSIQHHPDREAALKVVATAVESGVNFIDTANVYCVDDNDIGHNEILIVEALKKMGALDKVHIATKGGLVRPEGRWETKGDPAFLRKSCEQSLKALEVNEITLYQLHAIDDDVPMADSVGELSRLQEEGKVVHIGLSNFSLGELKEAATICRFETVQNRCNPMWRQDLDNGVTDWCRENKITFIPYSPVGGGLRHTVLSSHPVMQDLAAKLNTSTYCLALAYLLQQGEHMLPIPGASKTTSILDSVKAVEITLSNDEMETISRLQP